MSSKKGVIAAIAIAGGVVITALTMAEIRRKREKQKIEVKAKETISDGIADTARGSSEELFPRLVSPGEKNARHINRATCRIKLKGKCCCSGLAVRLLSELWVMTVDTGMSVQDGYSVEFGKLEYPAFVSYSANGLCLLKVDAKLSTLEARGRPPLRITDMIGAVKPDKLYQVFDGINKYSVGVVRNISGHNFVYDCELNMDISFAVGQPLVDFSGTIVGLNTGGSASGFMGTSIDHLASMAWEVAQKANCSVAVPGDRKLEIEHKYSQTKVESEVCVEDLLTFRVLGVYTVPSSVFESVLLRKDMLENGPSFVQFIGRQNGVYQYADFLRTPFIPVDGERKRYNTDSFEEKIMEARSAADLAKVRASLGDPFVADWRHALQVVRLSEEEKKYGAVFEKAWNAVCRINICTEPRATGVYVQSPISGKTYVLTTFDVSSRRDALQYYALFFPKWPNPPFYIPCYSIAKTGGVGSKTWALINISEDCEDKLYKNGIIPIVLSQSSIEVHERDWIITMGFPRVELLLDELPLRMVYPHYACGVARRWCSVGQVIDYPKIETHSENVFTHDCPALAGSCGSILLNRCGELIGLHCTVRQDESTGRFIGLNDAVSCRSWISAVDI